ncbi:TPA: GNAT family N-acetyltransferase [Candidatus Bathyarchaeota archaeon]|nr:GNAT family N-acetyltransferase [Candidatus Bathyarchaeota archaeon]
MGAVSVRDVTEANIEDVFRVCSCGRLEDPIQKEGIEIRRHWLREMIQEYGTCVKIAYLEGKPVAHLMFYPEEAVPFLSSTREGVVLLRCVYNPFEEARGKGASTALVSSLIEDCRGSPKFLKGVECSFIVSEPFNTGEGTPMEKFYASSGFVRRGDEMIYEINGRYVLPKRLVWNPDHANKEAATVIYNPTCEYSYISATRVRDAINILYPNLPVWLIDQWQKPEASLSLANEWLVVKGTPIKSGLKDRKSFDAEIKQAVEGSS